MLCFEFFVCYPSFVLFRNVCLCSLLTLRSSGRNLLVKMCDMITISQFFLVQSSLKSSLSYHVNLFIITNNICSFGYAIFSLIWCKKRKITYSKSSVVFNWFHQWFSEYVTWKYVEIQHLTNLFCFFQCSLVTEIE